MRGLAFLLLAAPAAGFAENYALRFDGHALARMKPSTGLHITHGITIEAWVKPEGGDPNQNFRFVVSRNMGGTGYSFVLGNNFAVQGQTQSLVIPHDTWTHVSWVSNNRISKLFLNGKLANTQPVTEILKDNDEFFWVGCSPFAGLPGNQVTGFSGLIDEVRVWSVPRSERQIKRDMRRLLSSRTTHLRVYLPMDEGRGDSAKNREGRTGPLLFGESIGAANRVPVWEKVPSLRDR
jgi:hypothetical protein